MIKFSGSIKKKGWKNKENRRKENIQKNPNKSFKEKKGWKKETSNIFFNPKALFDNVAWRKIKWITTRKSKIKGNKKWKEKNRFRRMSLTLNLPHNHKTRNFPIIGITLIKFVITVAAQNLICPQGNT